MKKIKTLSKPIGEIAREFRKEVLGWTQKRLAENIGLTFQDIGRFERGEITSGRIMLWLMINGMNRYIEQYIEDKYIPTY